MSSRSYKVQVGCMGIAIFIGVVLVVALIALTIYKISNQVSQNENIVNFYDANATLIWAVFTTVAMVGLGTMMKRYGKDEPIEVKILPGCILGCGGTVLFIFLFTGIGELYNLLPDNMNRESEFNLFIIPSAFISAVITLWFIGELGHFVRTLFRRSKK